MAAIDYVKIKCTYIIDNTEHKDMWWYNEGIMCKYEDWEDWYDADGFDPYNFTESDDDIPNFNSVNEMRDWVLYNHYPDTLDVKVETIE